MISACVLVLCTLCVAVGISSGKGILMTNVQRICEECGESGPLNVRYCPHCGFDTQAALPMSTRNLPMVIGKAALPLLAGVASLALRAGWKLLQQRLETATLQSGTPQPTQPAANAKPVPPVARQSTAPTRARRTIHIRSSWAVGDVNGNWRQGTSEHTIEFED